MVKNGLRWFGEEFQRRPLPKEETTMSVRRFPAPIVKEILPQQAVFFTAENHTTDVTFRLLYL
jgi:hypothetical protein